MELLEMMKNRRSVRKYTDQEIPEETLNQILAAGMLAPSGRSRKPWQVVVVRDPETIRALTGCRQGGVRMFQTATCAIVVVCDKNKTDTYIEDGSLFMGNMHLMASALGVGSCWVQIRLRPSDQEGVSSDAFVHSLLSIPEDMMVEAILVLGYPDEDKQPCPEPTFPNEIVHLEKW